jgi:hypothetical protein
MKAKGNDHRLLEQSKWRKTDKKRKQAWQRQGSQGVGCLSAQHPNF